MMYKIIVKQKGKKDMIKEHVDKLNSIIIVSELKMKFRRQIREGLMKIEVVEE